MDAVEAARKLLDSDVWDLLPREAAEPIRGVIVLLLEEVERLRRRVAELEERLGRHSGNSSQPRSLDPPAVKARRRKKGGEGGGGGRGGQPGHPRWERELLPEEQVERLERLWPRRCERCDGRELEPLDKGEGIEPRRRQVWDVEIKPKVTEYQAYARRWVGCGHVSWASFPAEAWTVVGPTLLAWYTYLRAEVGLSLRRVQELWREMCGVEVALAWLKKLERHLEDALDPVYAALGRHVQEGTVS